MPKSKLFGPEISIEKYADNSVEYKTLLEIYKYCTGYNIIEEIIGNTNKSFIEIRDCANYFSKILKMVLH